MLLSHRADFPILKAGLSLSSGSLAHSFAQGEICEILQKGMIYFMKRTAPIICLVLVATGLSLIPLLHGAPPLLAQYRQSNDNSTSNSARNKNVSLLKIINIIKKDYGGRLLEVELERERIGGARILVYEAKVLTPNGNVLKLYYDAKTAKLLKQKGHTSKSRRKKRSSHKKKYRYKKHRKKHDDEDHHKDHDDD